ncbi:ADP-ribosylglycohydrolase family protein [Rheinheimera baltica]|uniref:ADP-ribosylglycohydrolase family protein n=1 Tax=Rheinheimera baltica TaxID=67576 RepID=A0ABT9I352_9GAMM|nr:ADP-ribosylglycohydrolase family protein [Rheinheimera baltica]MDP5137804.1 ADP-ribosylglycohydrolase family protein [Rheinheimera baltica]MDP5189524.1 ADP-ribosylglycohydrolase family protein [Rheinheimera baltica]
MQFTGCRLFLPLLLIMTLPAAAVTAPASVCQPLSANGHVMQKDDYVDKVQGFWLGLSIGNWTGLVTEMDKIGGDGPAGQFYTRNDWQAKDQPSIWGQGIPSELSGTIDWVVAAEDNVWGSDDDSDIEYIYLKLMYDSRQPLLSAEQIRAGWLAHIYTDTDTPFKTLDGKPENYLWVSNQYAFDLMLQNILPPYTGMPGNNPHYDMIDAQLTTELFGILAPFRPDVASRLAYLPIRTTAYAEAADIANFYVVLHALAASVDSNKPLQPQILHIASQARADLPSNQYPAKMFDFVLSLYKAGVPWEGARDALYQRYQLEQQDGYEITGKKLYCNGCFAAGINFAASLVSLFYGEGDIQQTLKIATLAGWDSDNPAATWGGLYGFILGRRGVEQAFEQRFSTKFNIHRTRKGFANNGIDNFANMAHMASTIVEDVLRQHLALSMPADASCWHIPAVVKPITEP